MFQGGVNIDMHMFIFLNIKQTHTYGPQVRKFKMGSVHLQYITSGFSKHINTEAHSLLEKEHGDGKVLLCVGYLQVHALIRRTKTHFQTVVIYV